MRASATTWGKFTLTGKSTSDLYYDSVARPNISSGTLSLGDTSTQGAYNRYDDLIIPRSIRVKFVIAY